MVVWAFPSQDVECTDGVLWGKKEAGRGARGVLFAAVEAVV